MDSLVDLDKLELLVEGNKSWLVTMKELRPMIAELRASRKLTKAVTLTRAAGLIAAWLQIARNEDENEAIGEILIALAELEALDV